MKRHDDAEQRVSTWLHDEAQGELPDWVLDQTFSTTRATPQRHGLRGRLASFADRDTTTRRKLVFTFTTMTAVAAGAILATSAIFIGTSDQSTTPAAEAPMISVEEESYSGMFAYGPGCVGDGGVEIEKCWEMSGVTFSDPRFQGSVTMLANPDYTDQDIYRNQFTITTDEGVWRGDPVPGILTGTDTGAPSVHLFTGEGAYDGLYSVATVELTSGVFYLAGRVVDGGFPELPER